MKLTAQDRDVRLLLLVRHAQAGDPERFQREQGRPDRERPLSAEGYSRNRAAAAGLKRLLGRVDHVWSSPYIRARQTAEGIADAFGTALQAPEALLPPWHPRPLGDWLDPQLREGETAVLVGHEPDLSALIGYWICGGSVSPVPMEKGSVCALRASGKLGPGRLELLWKLPQPVLRGL